VAKAKSAEYWASMAQAKKKANTKSEAVTWGRIAAVLGWGIGDLENEVEPQFHEDARRAYEKRKRSAA
jgi:hypothetical protein